MGDLHGSISHLRSIRLPLVSDRRWRRDTVSPVLDLEPSPVPSGRDAVLLAIAPDLAFFSAALVDLM
jgi:hypothetical protein